MKKAILAATAALLIAAPAIGVAQDNHHEGGGRPSGGAPAAHPPGAAPAHTVGPPQSAPQFHGAPPQDLHGGQPNAQVFHPQGAGGFQPGGAPRPQFNQPNGGYRPQGFANGQPQGAYHPQGFANGQPGRGYAAQDGRTQRLGAQPFGYGGHQFFRYRAAPYRFPGGYYGWANHSWRRGEWLPSVFITSSYFINDWYDFGLWQPDYGYQWIRVGADAVLINLADGQVVDVVPGVYYY
jgi:Ni/Co efflux regulator RcnB